MFIMAHFGRQNFGQFYGGQFSPYWLPRRHYQPGHPPVLVVQVPIPVTLENNLFDHDNLKSKSRAQVGLQSLLHQGLSEPDFYGDLVYKLKKIAGSNGFSARFIEVVSHCEKIGYNINVLQRAACLVVGPITVGNFAFLFNGTPVGRTSDSMMVPT